MTRTKFIAFFFFFIIIIFAHTISSSYYFMTQAIVIKDEWCLEKMKKRIAEKIDFDFSSSIYECPEKKGEYFPFKHIKAINQRNKNVFLLYVFRKYKSIRIIKLENKIRKTSIFFSNTPHSNFSSRHQQHF